jgi:hypothetical protein
MCGVMTAPADIDQHGPGRRIRTWIMRDLFMKVTGPVPRPGVGGPHPGQR